MSRLPGVQVIDATFGPPLTVYLVEADGLSLIDAGVASTVAEYIMPSLRAGHASAPDVRWILNTHAHHDHVGGNAEMRSANPDIKVAIGAADAGWAESPERYMTGLYVSSFAGVWEPPRAQHERVHALYPSGTAVDRRLRGGDVVDLGQGRHLRVIDAPAHSPGHILLHDENASVLFVGDAIQWRGNEIPGSGYLFPSYLDVDVYLNSLQAIRSTGARWVCTAHYGVLEGEQLAMALADSELFVSELDALLRGLLVSHGTIDLARAVDAAVAQWPQYSPMLQVYVTCAAHLDRLLEQGYVSASVAGDVKSWSATVKLLSPEVTRSASRCG